MLHPEAVVIRLKQNQFRVFSDPARFVVLVAGRRFGKTYLSVAKLIQTATTRPGSTSWYIAPTYKQAKMIAWKILKNYIPLEARESCNEQELTIILKNGSEISLKGADNPDSLRGVGLDFAILDEYADMHPTVWGEIIRPMLATTRGKVIFIGTPKGFDHFYEKYMSAQADRTGNWSGYHFTTIQGGYVPAEEVLAAKNDPTISEREFKQEWEASFENLTGRVFDSFSRIINDGVKGGNVKCIDEFDPKKPILVGMDFNVNPMTASFAQRDGKLINFFDELTLKNSDTYEMCDAIKLKFPNIHPSNFWIYPDPAGNSRSTKAQVGTTDYTILRKAGFRVYNAGKPYNLADRINTVNGLLKNAAGNRFVFFDPFKCKKTIKAFDGLCYKEDTKIPDKTSGLDHYTDNVSYLLMGVMPMKGRGTTTKEFRP
jgi:hypothetical protein